MILFPDDDTKTVAISLEAVEDIAMLLDDLAARAPADLQFDAQRAKSLAELLREKAQKARELKP